MVDIYDFNLNKVNEYINKIKTNYIRINNIQKGGMTRYVVNSSI